MKKFRILFKNRAIYGLGLAGIIMSLAGQAKADTKTAWIPVPLAKVGLHLQVDPKGIWSKDETEGEGGSGIWYGSYTSERLGGTIIISQMVNGSCGSPSDCPVRVVFNNGQTSKVLLDAEQMCAVGSDFKISASFNSIKACDHVVPLETIEK